MLFDEDRLAFPAPPAGKTRHSPRCSIGQVSMTHGSGNSWTATLGPYTSTGDGTVDCQIRATDGQSNTTDSSFGQITILACLP